MTRIPALQVRPGQRVWPHYIGPHLDVQSVLRTTHNKLPAIVLTGDEEGLGTVEVYVAEEHVCWVE